MLREKSDIHQEEGILPPDGDMDTLPEFQGLKTGAPVFAGSLVCRPAPDVRDLSARTIL